MKRYQVIALLSGWLMAGCATHISVMETHREDLSSQTKSLAIAARNLEEMIPRNSVDPGEQEASRAIADFHNEAESFARIAGVWNSTDQVNDEYERLVEAWVKLKRTFPQLKAESLRQEAYQRVAHEWEQLNRAAGYAGRKYEKETEDKYDGGK